MSRRAPGWLEVLLWPVAAIATVLAWLFSPRESLAVRTCCGCGEVKVCHNHPVYPACEDCFEAVDDARAM